MNLRVTAADRLEFGGKTYRIAIGKSGFSVNKREGDNCTPVGVYPLRECWWRQDRLPDAPQTGLTLHPTRIDDGWCDAPDHSAYNLHVKLPFSASHEKLWREDGVYDVVVPIGYNDQPVEAGKGSAIFMHVARDGYQGTEGCVALALPDLLEILRSVDPSTCIEILPDAAD